jgi:carbon monoxide dehydrogenase subunit G
LAQLGGRLIDSAAKKLADEFFEKFDVVGSKTGGAAETTPAWPERLG